MTKVNVDLNALGVRLIGCIEDSAAAQLLQWIFEANREAPPTKTIQVDARRTGSEPALPKEINWTILGSGLALAPNQIWYKHGRHVVKARYDVQGSRLVVQAKFNQRIDRRLRSALAPRGSTRWEDAIHDVRGSIYLPLFWFLSKTRSVTTLHASAIAWAGKGLLLAGLNGSGKTTLAARLKEMGADVLSDNYSLLDADGSILPFPELQRLVMPPPGESVLFRAFGKAFTGTQKALPLVPVWGIVLLSRASHFRIVRLTPRAALDGLRFIQRITPEFVEDSPLTLLDTHPSWLSSQGGSEILQDDLMARLVAITEAVPTYAITLPIEAHLTRADLHQMLEIILPSAKT